MNELKGNGSIEAISAIYEQPLNDLLYAAHNMHRQYHEPNSLQFSMLLSIKTGACPEDCGYCGQSGHYKTPVEKERLLSVEAVVQAAQEAKQAGAKRFCMGAAWRSPPEKSLPQLKQMIEKVKALGLETCMTLGLLTASQAASLKASGLDYYNHNIDTSPSYYKKIVSTRTFSDRLDTLKQVQEAGIKVCCGGILGLGETRQDRIEFLHALLGLPERPSSVPINQLIPVEGTPLADVAPVDWIELVRTIATARIILPESLIRLTAGRAQMSEALQALCFFAGANSVFIGDALLTEENSALIKDKELFCKLGVTERL